MTASEMQHAQCTEPSSFYDPNSEDARYNNCFDKVPCPGDRYALRRSFQKGISHLQRKLLEKKVMMKIIWNQTLFGFALNPRTAAATGALTKRAA